MKWFFFVYRKPGALPDIQSMQIRTCDPQLGSPVNLPVNVKIDKTADWLQVKPVAGKTPLEAGVALSNDVRNLPLGIYSAHIQVDSSSPLVINSPEIVNVTLQVVQQ